MVSACIAVSKSVAFCSAPKQLSRPILPYLAWSNSIFLCSISIGLWSLVTISMVPSLSPFFRAFISCSVLRGGKSLWLVSKLSSTLSVRVRLLIDTLQVTCSPFFLPCFISSTLSLVDIVGMCNLPPVYSKMYRSLATCKDSASDGMPLSPSSVALRCSFTIPFGAMSLSQGYDCTRPLKLWVYCSAILSKFGFAMGFL